MQQIRWHDVGLILSSVADGGPTSNQHRFNGSGLLGYSGVSSVCVTAGDVAALSTGAWESCGIYSMSEFTVTSDLFSFEYILIFLYAIQCRCSCLTYRHRRNPRDSIATRQLRIIFTCLFWWLESGVMMISRPFRRNKWLAFSQHIHRCAGEGKYSSSKENTTTWKVSRGSWWIGPDKVLIYLGSASADESKGSTILTFRKSHW